MSLFIVIFTCLVNVILGTFVLFRDSKAAFARSFFAMSCFICIWILANYVTGLGSLPLSLNSIANNITYVCGFGIVMSGLIFTYYFPAKRKVSKVEFWSIALVTLIITVLSFTHFIAGYVSITNKGLVFSIGSLLWLYILCFLGFVIMICRNTIRIPIHSNRNQRIQSHFVLAGFAISAILGLVFNVVVPFYNNNWNSTEFGPIATLVLITTIVYAIARYKLFNVRAAVIRTFAYVLSLITLGVIYYVLAYIISRIFFNAQSVVVAQSPVSIGLALVLAFVFQPIKRFFDKITNFIFYRDQYNTEEFIARLTRKLSTMTDLMALLKYASSEIRNTLKASSGAFLIYREEGDPLYITEERQRSFPHQDTAELDDYVRSANDSVILTEYLEKENHTLKRMLQSHRIALVLPIMQTDQITGYLFLGEHLSNQYTSRDVRALLTIADELLIAIQNALSVQEVRELNETLQHRINIATKELRATNAQLHRLDEAKDEFMSIASHQLRTPLTSVKGYLSMVLEGDAGKVNASQKKLLGEAFASSERMVHLINDFLNVSRLQTGKFVLDRSNVDLPTIVKEELSSLTTSAAGRGMSFSYSMPKKFPDQLSLDEGKIRQVIMNFSDNAIFYSDEGTKIKVDLSVDDKDVIFTVKDTGIGVPAEEQNHLFTKFFRATNARMQRPDGTGVGLFLAKKVVNAHGGDVIFESKVGKGSTFGFRIPLSKLTPVNDEN